MTESEHRKHLATLKAEIYSALDDRIQCQIDWLNAAQGSRDPHKEDLIEQKKWIIWAYRRAREDILKVVDESIEDSNNREELENL